MQRVDLYRQPPLLATEEYIEVAVTKDTAEFRNFIKIERQKDILLVALYDRTHLRSGKTEPVFRAWISLKEMEFRAFDDANGRESKAAIQNYHGVSWYLSDDTTFCDQKSKWEAIRFFRKQNYCCSNPVKMIKRCQEEIIAERNKRRHKNELEAWNAEMSKVPKYAPLGFKKFEKFGVTPIIFYDPKRMHCTFCDKTFPREGRWAKHNMVGICPQCKRGVTFKSWNKQRVFSQYGAIACIQKAGDAYVYRHYDVSATYKKDAFDNWTAIYRVEETKRRVAKKGMEEHYAYFRWNNSREFMWQKTGAYPYESKAVLFKGNLKQIFKGTELGKTEWMDFLPGTEPGMAENNWGIVKTLLKYPYMEFLKKAGLNKFVEELLTGKKIEGIKNDNYTSIADALGLTGQQLADMKKMDVGNVGRMWIKSGEKGEIIKWCDKYSIEPVYCDMVPMAPPRKVANLIKRGCCGAATKEQVFGEFRLYRDYINMARELGMDISDQIVWNNNRWKHFHDVYAEEMNKRKNEERDNDVNMRFCNITKDYKKNSKHFKSKRDGLMIITPRRASDITKEGRLQHHCVGATDNYMSKMNLRKTFILFLRKEEEPEKPFYTLEIDWQGNILQYYGAYDRKPEQERVDKWLEKYKKKFKKEAKDGINRDSAV